MILFKYLRSKVIFALLMMTMVIGLASATNSHPSFTVTTTKDAADSNPGDGVCQTVFGNGICTLRAAIQESNALPGDDTIILLSGKYNLTIRDVQEDLALSGDLDITENLTISGAGAADTIIDGQQLFDDRVFHIAHISATVEISNLTIRNGNISEGDGGGINNQGMLTLNDTTVANSRSDQKGGGVYNSGQLTINRSTINNNTIYEEDGDGGGIYNDGTLALNNSLVDYNQAGNSDNCFFCNGGGIYNNDTMSVNGSIINENSANDSGGGIYNVGALALDNGTIVNNNKTNSRGGGIYNDGMLTMKNTGIDWNSANSSGAGIYNSGSMEASHTLIHDNMASSHGGGLYNEDTVQLTNSVVRDNNATTNGGGIYNHKSLFVESSTIENNSTTSLGGGVFNDDDAVLNETLVKNNSATDGGGFYNSRQLTIDGSTINANSAKKSGGGIYNSDMFTLKNSTVSRNTAKNGGGVYIQNGQQSLTNSTISSNRALESGGGIHQATKDSSSLNMNSVTIANNTVDEDRNGSGDGGGLFALIGAVNIQNTLIGSNYDNSPTTKHPNCLALRPLNSLGYNLIEDMNGCQLNGETRGNQIGVSALIGPLQDNGGTSETHALLQGSPAIDGGNPDGCLDETGALLTTDQRGEPRPVDGDLNGSAICDIGAYEGVDSGDPPTPTPTATATPPPPTPTPTPTPQAASALITSNGGSVTHRYPGHSTTLTVPPGAVPISTTFTINYRIMPSVPGVLAGMDHFFELEASPNSFTPPLTLTINYSDTVRGPVIAGTERLYKWQNDQWVTQGISVTDQQPTQIIAQIDQLTLYGVLGESNWLYLPIIAK